MKGSVSLVSRYERILFWNPRPGCFCFDIICIEDEGSIGFACLVVTGGGGGGGGGVILWPDGNTAVCTARRDHLGFSIAVF